MGTNRDEVWKTSLKEYSKRYKEPNDPLFAKQKKCLQALLQLCRQRNIKLYVVAMPISTANRQLLPPGLYDKYMATLQEETAKAGVPLVDMAALGGYQDDDFYDTVHLNHKGGQRFISQVTSIIKADKDDIAYSPVLLKLDEKAVKPVQIASPAGAKGKTL
jgi:lysophospholipase L1-like esterase